MIQSDLFNLPVSGSLKPPLSEFGSRFHSPSQKGHKNAELPGTWRIIPVRKWLVTPIYKPFRPFVRGITRSLGDLRSPWLLTTYPSPGMILQVVGEKHNKPNLGKTEPSDSSSPAAMILSVHSLGCGLAFFFFF